jgi:hypothetical protein
MNWIIETLWTNRAYNDTFTLLLYWLPFVANAIAYPIRVWQRVQKDKAAIRGEVEYHSDWLQFGELIGYAAATILPLVNLCFFVFDTLGELWMLAWERLDWLFSIRLVPGAPPK